MSPAAFARAWLGQISATSDAPVPSTSIRQFNLAQSAAAAAVFDQTGKPHLAIGVLAFSSELDDSNIAAVGEMIHMAAARITARTGGISPFDAVEVAGAAAATVT